MIDEEYVKQLEEENEKLKEKIIGYAARAECYDYIMNNLTTSKSKKGKLVYQTFISTSCIDIVMSVDFCDMNLYHLMMLEDYQKIMRRNINV